MHLKKTGNAAVVGSRWYERRRVNKKRYESGGSERKIKAKNRGIKREKKRELEAQRRRRRSGNWGFLSEEAAGWGGQKQGEKKKKKISQLCVFVCWVIHHGLGRKGRRRRRGVKWGLRLGCVRVSRGGVARGYYLKKRQQWHKEEGSDGVAIFSSVFLASPNINELIYH